MDFYKGYLITKNKVSNEPRKGRTDFPSLESVKNLPEYAGVLADGIVLVDFDDPDQAAAALSIVTDLQIPCRAIKTTRGIHMLFSSPDRLPERTHCKTACGLEADYKCGYNNSYEVLKFEGQEREILINTGCSELPYFFYQIPGSRANLWRMKDGDGRDNTLYEYEIDCMKAGLSKEQIRSLFHVVNQYVFEDLLSDNDLDRITRDAAFEKILIHGNKPDMRSIADVMIKQDHVIRINEQTYIYQDQGRYTNDPDELERKMLSYYPTLSRYQCNEIHHYLRLQAPKKAVSDKRYISFRNGVYDLNSGQIRPHTECFIIPNHIPWNFNPDADGEQVEDAVYKWSCYDEQVFDLLEEVIGYSMYRENTFRKFFIIVGNKRNGKSKFLKLLSELIGTENTSYVSLESIDTRFHNALLYGKLLNVGDDIEDQTTIMHTAALKKITSGECITVERKGQDPFDFIPYTTLLFSANGIPYINDASGAVKDRMIVIPFNAHFEEGAEDNNPNILDELLTEDNMEYLILAGLRGLRRLLENKQFTQPAAVRAAMQQYLLESDPLAAFISENKTGIIGKPTAEVYVSYEHFCKDHDVTHRILSHTKFTQTVKSKLNCKTGVVNGKNTFRL